VVTAEAAPDAAEVDLDGLVDEATGVRYLGKARRGFDGRWTCLAVVGRALCRVEVRVRPTIRVDADPGDEDDRGERDAKLDRDLARVRR
jgi:hypothetical protein